MSTHPERLFLFEPGWRVAQKVGSEREFCFMMAPGQDYYHRLLDGEVYLVHADGERLCMACARRRGLLSHEGRPLREPRMLAQLDHLDPTSASSYPVEPADPGR